MTEENHTPDTAVDYDAQDTEGHFFRNDEDDTDETDDTEGHFIR
jgi:hypothetical protein